MPRELLSEREKSQLYEHKFPNEFRVNPNGDLFCILNLHIINNEKRFRIESHRSSVNHKKQLSNNRDNSKNQKVLVSWKKDFKSKSVEAFLSVDIPLYKLRNP